LRTRKFYQQVAGCDFHEFRLSRAKLILPRQHDTQGFNAAVAELYSAAGDLAVKIHIGGFSDTDIGKFVHDSPGYKGELYKRLGWAGQGQSVGLGFIDTLLAAFSAVSQQVVIGEQPLNSQF